MRNPIKSKQCTKCGKIKDINDFWFRKRGKDKRAIWCKSCAQNYNDKYNKKGTSAGLNHGKAIDLHTKAILANRQALNDWHKVGITEHDEKHLSMISKHKAEIKRHQQLNK